MATLPFSFKRLVRPPKEAPKRQVALPPGSLIFHGERRTEEFLIRAIEYTADTVEDVVTRHVDACERYKATQPVTWLHVTGLHDVAKVSALCEAFDVNTLSVEDILHTDSRSKLEDLDDHIFIVMRLLNRGEGDEMIDNQHFCLLLTEDTVITFQEAPTNTFDPVIERIHHGRGRIRQAKADYLAWAILDAVVDHHLATLDLLEQEINRFEHALQDSPDSVSANSILQLKSDVIELSRCVRPTREISFALLRTDSHLIDQSTRPFYRDLNDHTVDAAETIVSLRELSSSLRDFHMAVVSVRMNEIMKWLTCFSAIFLPLSFLAGVYGMNFHHMPELDEHWGYPAAWGLFILVALGMVLIFRKKRWL